MAAQVEVVAEIGDAGREQRRRTARDWGRQAAVSDFFLFRSLATCKLRTHLQAPDPLSVTPPDGIDVKLAVWASFQFLGPK